jgi:hypothetical protein
MENINTLRKINRQTKEYYKGLVDLSRSVNRLLEFLNFINMCIDFIEKKLPIDKLNDWSANSEILPVVNKRLNTLINSSLPDALPLIEPTINTSGSASSDCYSLLVNNFSYFEDNQTRNEFYKITDMYKGLVINEETQAGVSDYLAKTNPQAQIKYLNGSKQLQSLKPDEDYEGPLLLMRSALELTVDTLIKKIGVTGKKRVEYIPIIANTLAKDELSKIDLILINNNYMDLWKKLSITKNSFTDRDRAIGLALEVTSILNLLSKTLTS